MINYFNFKKYKDKVLITNDMGYYAFLSKEDFSLLIKDEIGDKHPIFAELTQKNFILNGHPFIVTGQAAGDYIRFKGYLRQSASLHIFVLTNRCNMHCKYCQAQSEKSEVYGFMTKEIAKKAVDIALQSPDSMLTFEMQGGEPLLNFDVMKYLIEYTEDNKKDKQIFYSITTNGTLINDDILNFFEKYKVSVSISLDGSQTIQRYNRPMNNGDDSFVYIKKNVPKLKERNIFGGAVLTTTNYSISRWKEIIDTYLSFDCHEIFIRPLTPLGYANDHWKEIGYTVDEFLNFYRNAIEYILQVNRQGVIIREMHAMIFLRKMLSQVSDNYMELRSPCGATVGQVAYYYDGNIYTCDEGRMIAQMGDDSFCLGNVFESSYYNLVKCDSCKAICGASILECLPGCSDCVYSPYCGTCPATTYALEHSIYTRSYKNYRCKTYSGMLDILFELLLNDENKSIFESWIEN